MHSGTAARICSVTQLWYPDPAISDGAVVLRRWAHTDLGCVEEASQDPRIPEMTSVPGSFSNEEGRAWIERQWGRLKHGEGISLAIADAATNEAIGAAVAMLRPQEGLLRGTAELGYWVIERARGRGAAARAVSLLASWILTTTNLARLEALVEPGNIPSLRVLETAKFRYEGRLRSYLAFPSRRADALMYSLLPSDLG